MVSIRGPRGVFRFFSQGGASFKIYTYNAQGALTTAHGAVPFSREARILWGGGSAPPEPHVNSWGFNLILQVGGGEWEKLSEKSTITFLFFQKPKWKKKLLKIPIYKGIPSTATMYRRQTAEGRRWGNPWGHEGQQHWIHHSWTNRKTFLSCPKFQINEPIILTIFHCTREHGQYIWNVGLKGMVMYIYLAVAIFLI